jgi:hypothetical protein
LQVWDEVWDKMSLNENWLRHGEGFMVMQRGLDLNLKLLVRSSWNPRLKMEVVVRP